MENVKPRTDNQSMNHYALAGFPLSVVGFTLASSVARLPWSLWLGSHDRVVGANRYGRNLLFFEGQFSPQPGMDAAKKESGLLEKKG
jgi:hypothetical protein